MLKETNKTSIKSDIALNVDVYEKFMSEFMKKFDFDIPKDYEIKILKKGSWKMKPSMVHDREERFAPKPHYWKNVRHSVLIVCQFVSNILYFYLCNIFYEV